MSRTQLQFAIEKQNANIFGQASPLKLQSLACKDEEKDNSHPHQPLRFTQVDWVTSTDHKPWLLLKNVLPPRQSQGW